MTVDCVYVCAYVTAQEGEERKEREYLLVQYSLRGDQSWYNVEEYSIRQYKV